uniref:Uncharacterized protein n=1 Tax=Ciona savignyi TaxID=51511 RepID=H2YXT7_CIOSA
MLPYQSPIKPYQASTSDVPVPSPSKISKLPISLHGLFGEANSLDDPISLPFIVQSPPCGSSYGSKNSPSPHKSPGSVVNSHQQPVLLSELTDCSLLESNQINGIYQKNTLCSYVSTYDNRRCTNSATANCNNGKTYCGKHLHVVNNPPVHIAANVRGQLKKAEQLHKKIAPMSYSPCITKLSFQHVEEPQSITLNSLNEGPYLTSASDKDTSVIDLTDSSYSYIPTRGEEVRVNKSTHSHPSVNNKTQSNIGSTARSNYHSSPSISFTPKVLSRPKHPAVSMDGDVLQAVVDLLNQNHDQLTSKQQIELLNSLGVAVATIQSPAQSSTDIPYRTTYCNQTTKPSNYTTQSMASMRRKVIPVTQTTVSGTLPSPSCQSKTAQKLPPVIVNAVSTVNTPTKPELGTKRPNSEPIEKPQNKKR